MVVAKMLPPVMFPVALINPPVNTLPPVIFAALVIVLVADINPPVNTLPPVMLALADTTEPNKLEPVTVPVELINPPVSKLPPVILPLADINPVTYSPVVANTATFDVPPTPTETLPPELTTVTFDVPKLMLDTLVITPVSKEPLPKI